MLPNQQHGRAGNGAGKNENRSAVGMRTGIVGIACNGALFLLKIIAGVISGSVSVIADGINNLSDAASSAITLLGFRMAQRPADEEHPYGHARYEYVAGLAVAFLILMMGVELARSALEKMFRPMPVDFSLLTLLALAGSILVKLWLWFFYRRQGRKIGAAVLHAAAADSRNDVIASSAVLAGCLAEHFLQIKIDGAVGFAVALFVLWSGGGIARETLSPLLGKRADRELEEQIRQLILSHEMILGVHDLLIHDYGPGQCFASVHTELDAAVDPLLCHEAIDHIERDVLRKMNVHLVIHHDPVVVNDTERSEMCRVVEEIVGTIDPQLAIHDLRIVRGSGKPRLVFDLEVPYAMRDRQQALKQEIDAALKAAGRRYKLAICFDDK